MRGPRQRLVVIGGDAAGMSAAAQARRLRDAGDLEIIVLEQGEDVSYSACGIPYWVSGAVAHVALGTHADEQGRVAGSVIGGRPGSRTARTPSRRPPGPATTPARRTSR